MSEVTPIILQIGSYESRYGFAGDEEPKHVIKTDSVSPNVLKNRQINDWDGYRKVVQKALTDLGVKSEETPMFAFHSQTCALKNRETFASFYFEELGTPYLMTSTNLIMASYTVGNSNCILVDMGDSCTDVAALVDSMFIKSSIIRSPTTGRAITNYLQKNVAGLSDHALAEACKHEFITVPTNFDQELENVKPLEYKGVSLGQERLFAGEAYFKPFFVELEGDGLADDIKQCINKCPINSRRELWEKVVCFGGAANLKGLQPRLLAELKAAAPPAFIENVRVEVAEKPEFLAWVGASSAATTESFRKEAITKKEYDEVGPMIVRQKMMT